MNYIISKAREFHAKQNWWIWKGEYEHFNEICEQLYAMSKEW